MGGKEECRENKGENSDLPWCSKKSQTDLKRLGVALYTRGAVWYDRRQCPRVREISSGGGGKKKSQVCKKPKKTGYERPIKAVV